MASATTLQTLNLRFIAALVFLLAALAAGPAAATVNVTVSGNTATAVIELPGVPYTELILTFDSPKNLTPGSVGISAQVVNPLDPALIARLPDPNLVSVPGAFPVEISVTPPASGGLSFANATQVEIHTYALEFSANSLFRIYKAPAGGTFYDITNQVAAGSVRTRGSTGGFSDFLILVDLVPTRDHADDKYAYLNARVQNPAINSKVRTKLISDLNSSQNAYNANNFALASSWVDTFRKDVSANAGKNIPNQWRALRDLDNIAGDLLGESASLKYDLGRLASGH